MSFNLNNCKILHFGYNNLNNTFVLERHIVETVDDKRDLGVMIQKDIKVSSRCMKVVKNAGFRLD